MVGRYVAHHRSRDDLCGVVRMKAYKGFDKDLKCRGYQYEIGGEYTHDDKASLCDSGFHACEHPLDVFYYYPPSNSRFCEVELDATDEKGNDTKRVGKHIKIGAEISVAGMVKAAVDFVFTNADWSKKEDHATGESGVASATGTSGVASATGESGVASATGWSGAASATGTSGVASATGTSGVASATGTSGAASAIGTRGAASATGTRGAASATGWSGAALASGFCSSACVEGEKSVAVASGRYCKAKGAKGCVLFLIERNDEWEIVAHKSVKVDGKRYKEGVWYQLIHGKVVTA